jgi:hypothetical protein
LAEKGLGLQQAELALEAERIGGLNEYYSGQVGAQRGKQQTDLQIAVMEHAREVASRDYGALSDFANALVAQQDPAAKDIMGILQLHGEQAGPWVAKYLLQERPDLLGDPGAQGPAGFDAGSAVDALIGS